jgi:hypothetical protein
VKTSFAAFVLSLSLAAPAAAQRIIQHGEIVIMEGDSTLVAGGAGQRQIGPAEQIAIVEHFLESYPDEFDELIIWPTFEDLGVGGAYFTSNVPGSSARLLGFVNMNQVGTFGSGVMPVLGQEFSHAWLAFVSFIDPTSGSVSQDLLGRMGAHWSQLLDANGSVQDGADWEDNGDGTFSVVGYMNKWSRLDLYLMGFVDPEEVPEFFLLRDAVTEPGGQPVGALGPVNVGTTVTATKVPVGVDDIIAAEGGLPPANTRQHDYRLAFVLITEPGVTAEQVIPTAEQLDLIRTEWNSTAEAWFENRGTMCTDVTVPCDIPHARFASGRFLEGEPSDGDGVLEPGEHANVEITWNNTGIGATVGATATLVPADERFTAPADVAITEMAEGATGTSVHDLEVPGDVSCGEAVEFEVTAHIEQREFKGSLVFIPGVVEGAIDGFSTDGGYRANIAMEDTAMSGVWDYGKAELVEHEGRTLQPNGGAGGVEDSAWWTGREMGFDWKANDVDTGFTTLTSAPLDLAGMYKPSLRYSVWYAALSFNGPEPAPTTGDDLVVEASSDEGVTWVEIDRVEGDPRAWERRDAAFEGLDTSAPVLVRFVARDAGDEQNLVEIGIDDVQIVSLSQDCAGGGGGCGCELGAGSGAGQGALALLVSIGLVVLRRRSSR